MARSVQRNHTLVLEKYIENILDFQSNIYHCQWAYLGIMLYSSLEGSEVQKLVDTRIVMF